MTLLTLTTVGFASGNHLSTGVLVFTAGLAFLGVSLFVVILGLAATAIVEGRVGLFSRSRRSMTSSITASGIMSGGLPRAAAPRRPRLRLEAGGQIAQPLGAADPGRRHDRGQPQQVRTVGQPGSAEPAGVQLRRPGPAVQRADQRVRDVRAARVSPVLLSGWSVSAMLADAT